MLGKVRLSAVVLQAEKKEIRQFFSATDIKPKKMFQTLSLLPDRHKPGCIVAKLDTGSVWIKAEAVSTACPGPEPYLSILPALFCVG